MIEMFCFFAIDSGDTSRSLHVLSQCTDKKLVPVKIPWKWEEENDPLGLSRITFFQAKCGQTSRLYSDPELWQNWHVARQERPMYKIKIIGPQYLLPILIFTSLTCSSYLLFSILNYFLIWFWIRWGIPSPQGKVALNGCLLFKEISCNKCCLRFKVYDAT